MVTVEVFLRQNPGKTIGMNLNFDGRNFVLWVDRLKIGQRLSDYFKWSNLQEDKKTST